MVDSIQLDTHILVVDDIDDWRNRVALSLRREGYSVQCASEYGEALDLLCSRQSFDLAIINIILQGEVKPGWKLDWTTLLDESVKRGTDVIVLTSMKEIDVLKLAYEDFGVKSVIFKQDMVQGEVADKVRLILDQRRCSFPEVKGVRDRMDWNTIIATAISAVSPYATAFALSTATAAGIKLGEEAFQGIRSLWQWIDQTISGTDDTAEQVWESFKQDPQKNATALTEVIRQLEPDDNSVLRGYLQGLIQEVQRRKGTQLFSLLDNSKYFTFNDVKRICGRVSLQWEDDLGSNPTREALARWVVNYAPTRNSEQDLIAAMLEVNPTVMLQ